MLFSKRRIYLDYASATPPLEEALDAVHRASRSFANPGSLHKDALEARALLQNSREKIAAELACKAREIVFTSGLTEANSLAIVGHARWLEVSRRTLEGTHWVVGSIEHSSVLESFAEIERMGGMVSHVDPESNGVYASKKIAAALRRETVFVSLGWGNNEIGTIQPLSAIAHAIHEHEKEHGTAILFHSDAGQAPLYRSPQVHTLGVDLFSLGSGKLYGPRGIGALYVGSRANIRPVLFGGAQERGVRPGTEDPALATGFAEALEVIAHERKAESERLRKLRDSFAAEIQKRLPDIVINGDLKHTLPHMLNMSIPGINAEYLALSLDHEGIAVSTKSACDEGQKASHVVHALGGEDWRAENTVRFSLGRGSRAGDLKRVAAIIADVVHRIR